MDRKTFFNTAYQFCEGHIELRALPEQRRAFCPIGDNEAIDKFCSENAKSNLYFGIATRDGISGKRENIINFPMLWCDVDFKETPREVAGDSYKRFPYKASIIAKSGGGVHFYWLLKEPAEKTEWEQIEDANRRIAAALSGDMNACDAARIFRVPDTVNQKYDTKPKCEIVEFSPDRQYEIDTFLDILPEVKTKKATVKTDDKQDHWLSKAMLGVGQGERNATAIKVAGYWINKVPASDVLTILTTWNLNNTPPLNSDELKTIVSQAAKYEPDKAQKRVDKSHVYNAQRMVDEYRGYIQTLNQNRLTLGIDEIDKKIRGVAGGEVCTIIARAGSYKTALLQNILKNFVQKSSLAAVFFSIEMPVANLTERYYGILQGWTGEIIEDIFLSDDTTQQQIMEKYLINDLKNLFVVPKKVGLSDIGNYVSLIQQEYGAKVGAIGIDYLGLMDERGQSEYEIVSKLARGAKDTAKLLNLPIIILSQVNRAGEGGEKEIKLEMGRGSGAIEEGADFVLGLWQVEKDPTVYAVGEYGLVCRILKNRKGPKGSRYLLDLDARCFKIGPTAKDYIPPQEEDKVTALKREWRD